MCMEATIGTNRCSRSVGKASSAKVKKMNMMLELNPDRCFTVTATVKEAEGVIQFNGEANDVQSKLNLERALKSVIHALKSGLIKTR